MATNETPEQREARLARRREQYRQRHAAETADAREARLERQRHSLQLFRNSFRDNETRLLNCWPRLPVRPLRMRILARFDVNVQKSLGFPSSS